MSSRPRIRFTTQSSGGAGARQLGVGKNYRLDYVEGWSQVAPPEGWTDADTKRLEQFLHPS